MRKLIAGFAASLDGYIEGPNGEYDWILIDKEMDFSEQAKQFDTYLFGRKTYEKVRLMGGKSSPGITNYVASRTLTVVDKNFTLLKGDVNEQIKKIKQQDGRDIALFGGAGLLASLLDLGLVDEISVAVIPVLLGKGKPMIDPVKENVWLSLLTSEAYGNGTIKLTYQVGKKPVKKK